MNNIKVGMVLIGRNEGSRLRETLGAAIAFGLPLVYVDSQSSDNSVAIASGMGVNVVQLDVAGPINAARARNQGVAYLLEVDSGIKYVHFIDGDTVFDASWRDISINCLEGDEKTAAVCGLLREKDQSKSIYARLMGVEWLLMGRQKKQCGGNATIRVGALQSVCGYNDSLIAGEDPDLYSRLSAEGGKVVALDTPMGEHDARMLSFRQWGIRCTRCGFAYADTGDKKGVRSAVVFGGLIPLLVVISVFMFGVSGLVGLALYLVQAIRIFLARDISCLNVQDRRLYSCAVVLAKVPELIGVGIYWYGQFIGRSKTVIQYKD